MLYQNSHPRKPTLEQFFLPSLINIIELCVVGLLFTLAPRFLNDSDTGWHIRAGEWIVKSKTVPFTDPFSFTMTGRPWFAWEWLADTTLYFLHAIGGLEALVIASIFTLFITYSIVGRTSVNRGASPLIVALITIIFCGISSIHWLARPHLWTLLFLALWMRLLISPTPTLKKFLLLSIISGLLWPNLHGGFIILFPLIGIWAIFKWSKERFLIAVIALTTFFILSLLNPYGWNLYAHIGQYLLDSRFRFMVNEFQAPSWNTVTGKAVIISACVTALSGIWELTQRRFDVGVTVLFLSAATCMSIRHIGPLSIWAIPSVSLFVHSILWSLFNWTFSRRESTSRKYHTMKHPSGYLWTTILVALCIFWKENIPQNFPSTRFPVEAVKYLNEHKDQFKDQNLFAPDKFGGYLIYSRWPDEKVFVDGRSDFYAQGSVLNDSLSIIKAASGWPELMKKYQIEAVLIPSDSLLASELTTEADRKTENPLERWRLVYGDSVAQLFTMHK